MLLALLVPMLSFLQLPLAWLQCMQPKATPHMLLFCQHAQH